MKILRIYLAVTAIPVALLMPVLLYIYLHNVWLPIMSYIKEPSTWTFTGVVLAACSASVVIVSLVVGVKVLKPGRESKNSDTESNKKS